jgi:two-component system, cell cycle response regulator DivK
MPHGADQRVPQRPSTQPLILLVEEYSDAIEIYSASLQFHGFRVVAARRVVDALSFVESSPPDLIVMDVGLPDASAWDATRELKGNVATRHIPIVILTGHVFGEARQRAAECGCDAFLNKPCIPDELVRTIRKLLREAAARDAKSKPDSGG